MMINKYNSPEIDIIEINVSDVIMVSAGTPEVPFGVSEETEE